MLLQGILTQRIIIVLIFQVWPIFYLSYLAYKLLKRAKNRATYTLSSVFLFIAFTYSSISSFNLGLCLCKSNIFLSPTNLKLQLELITLSSAHLLKTSGSTFNKANVSSFDLSKLLFC